MKRFELRVVAARIARSVVLGSLLGVAWLSVVSNECSAQQEGDPQITWVQPQEGVQIVGRQFTLKFTLSGDPNGPFSTVDHVHYNVAPLGEASANPGKFTTRDLSGIQDIDIDQLLGSQAQPGVYEACAYMATIIHTHVTEPLCITFKLVFSGVTLDFPTATTVLTSSSGNQAVYSLFGESGIVQVQYQLDGNTPSTDQLGSGVFDLPSLTEGEHTLHVWGINSAGQRLGEDQSVTFTVRPRLSYLAVQEIAAALQQSILAAAPSDRQALLDRIYSQVSDMRLGGKKDRNPSYKNVSTKNAVKLFKAYQKAYTKISDKRYITYAKKALKITRSMLKR